MKVQCPQCGMLYQIDETKLPSQGIKVKCKQCDINFDIQKQYQDVKKKSGTEQLTEELIAKKYIQEKNEEAVIKTLQDGILKYAAQKKFRQAERLREQLIKIAPMALSEIISSGEIIEQEKMAAMDSKRMKPLADLYANFNKSEAAAFYFALNDFSVKAGVKVFEQGKFDDRLYFIQSGRLNLSYYDNEMGQQVNYATLREGDITGVEGFFTFSSHSYTLTSVEDSEISCLEKEIYEKILKENPIIESKLCNYCEVKKKICNLLSGKKGQARRAHKRHRTLLNGKIQMMDHDGNPSGQITMVNIIDISTGGLCYIVKNMKHYEAARLHKKWTHITISHKKGYIIQDVKIIARVVSIQFHPFGECSVHVQFKNPLDEKTVLEMARNPEKET